MKNKIPQRIKWGNRVYTFRNNKGNTICYENNPDNYYDDSYGEVLIIEYRPDMSPKDRLYVLYQIISRPHSSTSGFSASVESVNISGKPRIAIPV